MWRPRIASLLMLSPLLILSPSCADDEPAEHRDPRLGKHGKVRFVGGGGCSDSTVIAVGATARLDLEPVAPPLPSNLSVRSSDLHRAACLCGSRARRGYAWCCVGPFPRIVYSLPLLRRRPRLYGTHLADGCRFVMCL